ncbi:glycosyl hydrolase 108 family protein [Novilysobacter arseniciresistens]|uniref:glycosyl hydrolase 108 family protein n=1 Tax=Novilysobacter arseniciresistens TaxID=1385522 RepID=UPI00193A2312|nr:glycosyl hydrolase 108 family protein [Lysobacter arseniciresistens]
MWIVLGDVTTSGGRVVTASQFTDIDGKGVARRNDKATCPQHKGVFAIVGGYDPTTVIDDAEVALHGATLACGCQVLATQQFRVLNTTAPGASAAPASMSDGGAQPVGTRQFMPNSGSGLGADLADVSAVTAADVEAPEGAGPDDCEARFHKVSRVVLANEGGFVDDPDDAGGATNMGIAWRTWQNYAKTDLGVDPTLENLKRLTEDQAETIYRKRYWEPRGFCRIDNPRVALMVYDWTITSGKAVREVQQVLSGRFGADVTVDNAMGGQTIDAINDVPDQEALLNAIADARKDYYRSLTFNRDGSRNSNQKFLKGWLARVDRCLGVGQ